MAAQRPPATTPLHVHLEPGTGLAHTCPTERCEITGERPPDRALSDHPDDSTEPEPKCNGWGQHPYDCQ